MGSEIESILNSLKEIQELNSSDTNYESTVVGKVMSVNKEADGTVYCTVQPFDERRTTVNRVLLASPGSEPMFTPAVGGVVTVSLYNHNSGYVAQHGDVKTVNLAKGTQDYGGLLKIEQVVSKLNNVEKKLNAVILWLEGFVASYNLHTHAYINGTSPATTNTTLAQVNKTQEESLLETKRDELENTTVTHGNGKTEDTTAQENIANAKKEYENAVLNLENAQKFKDQMINEKKTETAGTTSYNLMQEQIDSIDRQIKRLQVVVADKKAFYDNLIKPKQ